MKKLYRSKKNRIIAGVLGGLGEYINVDPTVLRLIWVLMVVFTGIFPGVFIYFASAIIIPEEKK